MSRSRAAGMLVVLATALTLAIPQTAAPDDAKLLVEMDGDAVVGETLTAIVEPEDPDAVFQWLRCDAQGKPDCDKIAGATEDSYVVTDNDVSHRLAVRAKGAAGSDRSELTAVEEEASITSVTISPDQVPVVGDRLTADATTGDPAPTVSYQWWRCSAGEPLTCNEIEGATASTYEVVGADAGKRLAVSAKAGTDTLPMRSPPTAPVQAPPKVTSVAIAGQAVIGGTLTAQATATGSPAPSLGYAWLRCPADPASPCQPIAGATNAAYLIQPADAAQTLVASATATNPAGADTARSAPTAAVPEPVTGGAFEQLGAVLAAPSVSRPLYLRPFPVVRIRGLLVDGGAEVTLLRVTAPRGSSVRVRCRRSGCPLRRRTLGVGRIRAFERFLPAGVRITLRVTKPGFIGKHARILIRDGRPPARRDSCLLPGRKRAVTCPRP
jgi:hypothetical protein